MATGVRFPDVCLLLGSDRSTVAHHLLLGVGSGCRRHRGSGKWPHHNNRRPDASRPVLDSYQVGEPEGARFIGAGLAPECLCRTAMPCRKRMQGSYRLPQQPTPPMRTPQAEEASLAPCCSARLWPCSAPAWCGLFTLFPLQCPEDQNAPIGHRSKHGHGELLNSAAASRMVSCGA